MAERRTMFMCESCNKWFISMDVFIRHPCCLTNQAANSSSITGGQNEIVEGVNLNAEASESQIQNEIESQESQQTWTQAATLLLIAEYKDRKRLIDEGKMRKNKAFQDISIALKAHGYLFSAEQCNGRLKTITKAYKQVKDHNSKSGNDSKTYVYDKELDDLYGGCPKIQPVFVMSSSAGSSVPEDTQGQENDTKTASTGNPDSNKRQLQDAKDSEGNSTKAKKTRFSELTLYFDKHQEQQEERRKVERSDKQKRHDDKMSLFCEFIDVMKERK